VSKGTAIVVMLVIAAAVAGVGNLCLSAGARAGAREGGQGLQLSWSLLSNYVLMLGLVFYGLSAVLYVKLLAQVDISRAYPIVVGATFAIVLAGASFILRERITLWRAVGCVLIWVGILIAGK
jgi:multidrug transporter EmrE-like cation transporter